MDPKNPNVILVSEDAKTGPIAWSQEGCSMRQNFLGARSQELFCLTLVAATDTKVSIDTFVQQVSAHVAFIEIAY